MVCRRGRYRFLFLLFLAITPPFLSERPTARRCEFHQPLQSPPNWERAGPYHDSVEASQRLLLTPTFLIHLLWMSGLSLLSVVALMDLLLKLVFVSCNLGVKYATDATLAQTTVARSVYESSDPSMHVFVRDHTEQSHCLYLSAKATGIELKRIVSAKTGIPATIYNLVHENKHVLLRKPLQEQNISPGSNIHLTLGLKGGSGGECSVCCSCAGEYRCSDCGVMLFCSTCNTFWHTNNPQRAGHKVESVESPTFSQRENISYSEELNSSPDCNLESSGVMDSSFTDNEIDLDSTENIEEMCRVGTLAERFSLTKFKPFQREVITHCLNGNDTIVIQPTGSGKSLCYQFPAIYTGKLAIVISPTISLMMDQVKKLTEKGLPCAFVGSAQHNKQIDEEILRGDSNIKVLFVTPEWLFSSNKLDRVRELAANNKLSLVAIDEAHLIFDWQTFRDKYRHLQHIKTDLPTVPVMALTATANPSILGKLQSLLHNPHISKSSVNRPNVYYRAEKLPPKGKQTQFNRGDYSAFAQKTRDLIEDDCAIVYTDFVADVGPILCALRSLGLECAGYYGEMDADERQLAQEAWMQGNVQVMVATKAFGLGIDKPNIRHVIRNGVPESISAWVQESGRAGRDGGNATATIFYEESDTDHAGAWIKDYVKNPPVRDDILRKFGESWKFIYAGLAGRCRRCVITQEFGEPNSNAVGMNGLCCDVCTDLSSKELRNCSKEFKVAFDAVQQIGSKGESKLTEWIRGNTRPWMKAFNKSSTSFANSCGRSEIWWRGFFRKCHAIGLLERKLCNLAKSNQHYAIMAIYTSTWKGQKVITDDEPIMLLDSEEDVVRHRTFSGTSTICAKKRCAKGGRLIDRLLELMNNKENWKLLESKQEYLYPGTFSSVTHQHMVFIQDIDKIRPEGVVQGDFVWRDIQLSKGKTNLPRGVKVNIDGKEETLNYRMAPCAGIKKCPENGCNYIVPIKEHHPCPKHNVPLVKDEGNCPVYFVYIEPPNKEDKRRWCGGLVTHQKEPCANLHTHAIPPPSSLQSSTVAALKDAAARCPSLTPQSVSQGVGIGYMIGFEDKAACNMDRLRYQLKKAQGPKVDSNTVITQFEDIANEVDEADEKGSSALSGGASLVETSQEKYRRLGRPYIRMAGIEEGVKYFLVMSPLMSTTLASTPFIETDVTYNETKEYPYLFNATAFDPLTMHWMVVCRIRITKQTKLEHALCFKLMFERCKRDNPEFDVGKTLLGIVMDWSDAEADGLRLAVGEETANQLLKGCKVHWIRSYQRVADKVCKHQHPEIRRVEREAFNLLASAVQKVQTKQHVLQLFQCLCGKTDIALVQHIVPGLTASHIATVKENSNWEGALHWVNWWIRPGHLRMLSQAFTEMSKAAWENAPSTTNAVERKNLDIKQKNPVHFKAAMIKSYKLDKSLLPVRRFVYHIRMLLRKISRSKPQKKQNSV